MKAKYLKPCINEDVLLCEEDLMLTASGDGTKIVEDGGSTEGKVTEGDARSYRRSVWDDEESLDEEF
jgi:hypothetical protein